MSQKKKKKPGKNWHEVKIMADGTLLSLTIQCGAPGDLASTHLSKVIDHNQISMIALAIFQMHITSASIQTLTSYNQPVIVCNCLKVYSS
jgi:hypothetical protein